MVRHKLYVGIEANNTGKTRTIGCRHKIKEYSLHINADCNGQSNVTGNIRLKYNDTTDEIDIFVDCAKYRVVNVRSLQ